MISKIQKCFFILDKKEIYSSLILLLLMVIGVFAEMLSISLIIPILGIIQNPDIIFENEFFASLNIIEKFADLESFYVILLSITIFIFIFKNIYLFLQQAYQIKFVFNIQKKLSNKLFKSYIEMDYQNYLNRNTATLTRNSLIEVEQFTGTIMSFCYVILDLLLILGLTLVMIIRDPSSSFYILGFIGTIIFFFQIFTRKKILKLGKSRQFSDEKRMLSLQEGLGGIKEIKIFGRELYFIDKYSKYNSSSADILSSVTILRSIPKLLMESLAIISILTLVIYMLLTEGDMNEFLISLGLFAAIAFKIFPSVSRLLTSLQVLRYSNPIIDLLYNEFAELAKYKITTKETRVIKRNYKKSELKNIKISNLSFSYGENLKIFENLNLEIEPGSLVGIIGPSGVGKSTLVDILMGLLKPNKGTIYYGEYNIHEKIELWQSNIGYVPQNIYLTDDTLKKNIAYGLRDSEIDNDLIKNAISQSNLSEFIENLRDQVDTIVGERGNRISGGQRQRIGIARALYHNPNILIFDEATSALDHKTEEQIINSINRLKKIKTIIIISHRPSTLKKCDVIYKLKDYNLQKLT